MVAQTIKSASVNGVEIELGDGGFVDAKGYANLVRAALSKAFPGERFSVRTKRYAHADSIWVDWDGELSEDTVSAAVAVFECFKWDISGCRYPIEHWLLPDGSVRHRRIGASADGIERMYAQPHPTALPIHSFVTVSCQRRYNGN